MDNLLKKALIGIIIVTKPPVFLTVSILVVIGYLTFVVLTCKFPGDPFKGVPHKTTRAIHRLPANRDLFERRCQPSVWTTRK